MNFNLYRSILLHKKKITRLNDYLCKLTIFFGSSDLMSSGDGVYWFFGIKANYFIVSSQFLVPSTKTPNTNMKVVSITDMHIYATLCEDSFGDYYFVRLAFDLISFLQHYYYFIIFFRITSQK